MGSSVSYQQHQKHQPSGIFRRSRESAREDREPGAICSGEGVPGSDGRLVEVSTAWSSSAPASLLLEPHRRHIPSTIRTETAVTVDISVRRALGCDARWALRVRRCAWTVNGHGRLRRGRMAQRATRSSLTYATTCGTALRTETEIKESERGKQRVRGRQRSPEVAFGRFGRTGCEMSFIQSLFILEQSVRILLLMSFDRKPQDD